MFTTKIAGAAAALALLAAPATAAAHNGHHHGRHHHHKADVREVTGAATASVTSFTAGDLTLTLPSGRTFTAAVTKKTIIDCWTAAPQAATARHGGGDDDGPNHDAGDDNGGEDNHQSGDDNQGDDNGNGRCDSTALVAGAKVAVAKLALLGGDATWKKVVIVK